MPIHVIGQISKCNNYFLNSDRTTNIDFTNDECNRNNMKNISLERPTYYLLLQF